MVHKERSIFVSYRRADSAGHTGRLHDHLMSLLPNDVRLFMDVSTLEPGEDWLDAIEEAIIGCDILLVVIGQHWLHLSDSHGRRRLDKPDDVVRLEIAVGLQTSTVRVVPILVGDAYMPPAGSLPANIADLHECNAFTISDDTFREDTQRLVSAINKIFAQQDIISHPMYVDIDSNRIIEDWERVPLGDLVEFVSYEPIRADERSIGDVPLYSTNGIKDFIGQPTLTGDYVLIATKGKGLLHRSIPVVFRAQGAFAVGNNLMVVRPKDERILLDYLVHYLQVTDFTPYVVETATPELTKQEFREIAIAIPPIEEQARIVAYIQESMAAIDTEEERLRAEIEQLNIDRHDVMQTAFSGEL
ncbi:MAG: restriction endonuclease subunit S [Chloroflexota bacterium]